ncbi:polyferredoxin [Pseudoalteromonas sp. MBR-15]|jgi:polyferredoxin|uniref:Uncharacterized protein n=2 Tax=Pseudoalteromonas lipolytica TaxID=570156 RepID=A0ABY1GU47_9GAMM|nr:hypothetical protein SAMN04487854_11852 [Pseudoalteromonas lipolytica]|tara:strand:- start:1647 stop:1907 length:261 start_codon:yes stop_codon:yes gene_type:complete
MLVLKMTEKNIIRTLKVFIILGICLIILGHSLLASNYLDESLGVHGIMISAACIAVGVLFSLPTKIYLTILLMKLESELTTKNTHV